MSELQGIVTFTYEKATYGIPLKSVAEVLGHCKVNNLPGLPPHVVGMINLRGTIIAAIDIGPLIDKMGTDSPAAIVLKHELYNQDLSESEQRNVAILVDKIGDIVTDLSWVRHPVPANVSPQMLSLLDGILNTGNKTISLINVDELLRKCTREST